ncbi:trihelix transcription factor PTL-like [Phoenix dactylifera]|uniref:Trihelix transcription factor PTL-like n=1 Tax=Phoenix dactylifera TaxID=42345 RepID=A0A8B7D5J4_PHODC|nr:trihelix transcription factor PTL-like [Phoenix dactylifera]
MMPIAEQYSLPNLHQLLMAGKPPFPAVSHGLPDPFSAHHQSLVASPQHYGMVLVVSKGEEMSSAPYPPPPPPPLLPPGSSEELGGVGAGGETQRRWPRQETLTLLEVRARLDSRFREAAHKAPLWDEVSRIMAEENGYQRSGRKCREKLENLYKYYKKTKEGKAGRQDGKHYRFFRQLEALYGGNNNAITNKPLLHATTSSATQANNEPLQALYESLVLSNSTEFGSSSTEEDGGEEGEDQNTILAFQSNELDMEKGTRSFKRSRNSWQSKIKEFVDIQVRRFMEVQEAWLEKMLNTLEQMEQERISREEAWRKQEAARLDREYRLWASEKAWIEARDSAIMEALEKISRREMKPQFREFASIGILEGDVNHNGMESEIAHGNLSSRRWLDSEIIGLKASIKSKLQEGGHAKGDLWEEISAAMACLGYDPSSKGCKDKLEEINDYFRKTKECNKKRRENKRTCPYYKNLESSDGQRGKEDCYEDVGQAAETVDPQPSNGTSSSNGDLIGCLDCCFRLLISEKEFVGEQ